jgi:hypothetical protein
MTLQLRSELLKLRTIRMPIVFLLLALGLALLTVFVDGLTATLDELGTRQEQRKLLGQAATNAVFLAVFLGLLAATNEFRYGTIRPALIFEPRRHVVLGAKLAAGALVGALLGVACVVVSFAAGLALLAARGVEISLGVANTLLLVFGTIAASALCAAIGVGIGASIRNQVAAIATLAVYSLVVDVLFFTAVPSVGRFLPAASSNALAGLPDAELLMPLAGAVVLAGWTVVFILTAAARTARSDI